MLQGTLNNNKRIARNTLFLYFRMLLTMLVSLYTSRVVLNVLGVTDFGIYNVVGGVVVLFSFLNGAMSAATQRFLSFELGKNDLKEVKRIFSMSFTVHITIILIVIILAETIGLWFLNTQMNLPKERYNIANWVYQFSIVTTCIGIIQVPFNASIIAYEKMSFFAYIGIIEVLFKLFVAFFLFYISYDKLKVYSILLFFVALCILGVYYIYCNKKISTCKYIFFLDKELYAKLMSFSGWSLLGSIATMSASQGVNILLNIFYGVVVNASMGISNQVNGAVNSFISSFQTAFRPQIVKLYASQQEEELKNLIYRTTKISFFLLFTLALPIILNIEFILKLWLKTVPEYAAEFCCIILICSLVESLSGPLWMAIQAIGRIKRYQIWISATLMLNIILSYIFLKHGYDPGIVLMIRLFVYFLCLIIRILFIKAYMNIQISDFINKILARVLFIILITLPIPFIIGYIYTGWIGLISTTLSFMLIMFFSVYSIGCTKVERNAIRLFIFNKIKYKKIK